jgi:hypothetical protein
MHNFPAIKGVAATLSVNGRVRRVLATAAATTHNVSNC